MHGLAARRPDGEHSMPAPEVTEASQGTDNSQHERRRLGHAGADDHPSYLGRANLLWIAKRNASSIDRLAEPKGPLK